MNINKCVSNYTTKDIIIIGILLLIIVFVGDKSIKNKAKKKLKSRFACEVETVSDIGESIGYYMTVCNDLSLITEYLNILENITVEDLEKAANKYLNINNAVISVLMPE